KYPDVALHVNASARRVDLRREGYDVAPRASTDEVRAFIDAVVEWARARLASFGITRSSRKLGPARPRPPGSRAA
ncbi:MAG TPA: hypothetical protein VER33_05540, partial [Polyangiaceae bacterium]|nr:hypothetical protein [Polyangiaceae bacterium]